MRVIVIREKSAGIVANIIYIYYIYDFIHNHIYLLIPLCAVISCNLLPSQVAGLF